MANKRVLIVDNDKDISLMLQHSLKMLGPEYEVVTVADTVTAISLIEKEPFAVVITDYMMPVMTGIDLAMAVRRISPETQVVLMTAYGTNSLRDTTKFLGLDGYLDKPFPLERVQEIVKRAVSQTSPTAKPEKTSHPEKLRLSQAVYEQLHTLQNNTGIRCVLLITADGRPVQVVGQTDGFEVASVSALVAANFLAAAELAKLVGNQTIFKSSYYEGATYNIYAHDVNEKLLLALVFDARQKPGSVWFYTKHAASTLAELLSQSAAAGSNAPRPT
jgi:CheY-like chemotaxis protein/predicted regulator of Ras-like GTPase activity (Roadblock/LC7/MglB family)